MLRRKARVRDRGALARGARTIAKHGGGDAQAKQYGSIVEQHFGRSLLDGDGKIDVFDGVYIQFPSSDGQFIWSGIFQYLFREAAREMLECFVEGLYSRSDD